MWPNDFANLIIVFFGLEDPSHQGAAVMVALGLYAFALLALVSAVVLAMEITEK